TLAIGALSVASAIFLILELDAPYSGMLRLPQPLFFRRSTFSANSQISATVIATSEWAEQFSRRSAYSIEAWIADLHQSRAEGPRCAEDGAPSRGGEQLSGGSAFHAVIRSSA